MRRGATSGEVSGEGLRRRRQGAAVAAVTQGAGGVLGRRAGEGWRGAGCGGALGFGFDDLEGGAWVVIWGRGEVTGGRGQGIRLGIGITK